MSLLLALYLLLIQSFAMAPSAHVAFDGARAHSPSAAVELRRVEAARDESVRADAAPRQATGWVRDARRVGAVSATRGDVAPTRTLTSGAALGRLSMEAAFAASIRVRTLDASHEVCGRGALLPYFPTAPPLQG